ncbi:MAG TPA: RNB domain-containing ribonuclease, partial [Burkholderiaceae bacterium]|nr:RNB domain-containing ribonuclease [Burkholderiaceae bacterium]
LWYFARNLLAQREQVRGRPEPVGRVDYSFELEGVDDQARVSIRQRRRGAPLDLIVAELMIFANSTWGKWLSAHRTAGIYRSQALGRVKMGTVPAPHEGIGVEHYAWCTSPLRRYVDLVNQRQLLAAVRAQTPPYSSNDAELFGVVSGFESAYSAYAEFQQKLERYWSLRWFQQEKMTRVGATVLKSDVLRLDGVPFITRLPGLPDLPRGQKVELDIISMDHVDLTLEARMHRVLAAQSIVEADDDEIVASLDLPPLSAAEQSAEPDAAVNEATKEPSAGNSTAS